VVARPAFRCGRNNRAQNLAALYLGRLLFLLCGLGMKWAFALRRLPFGCDRTECAMIRNCQPRTDGNHNGCGSSKIPLHCRCHARFQSSTCRRRSNVFFCINDWPNGGRDCFRRHAFTRVSRCRTGLAELRLLNPRCHQHRSEQQRGCEIIRCAR